MILIRFIGMIGSFGGGVKGLFINTPHRWFKINALGLEFEFTAIV